MFFSFALQEFPEFILNMKLKIPGIQPKYVQAYMLYIRVYTGMYSD